MQISLTIIAGENDTGKSTLGKILFSVAKSDNIKSIYVSGIKVL